MELLYSLFLNGICWKCHSIPNCHEENFFSRRKKVIQHWLLVNKMIRKCSYLECSHLHLLMIYDTNSYHVLSKPISQKFLKCLNFSDLNDPTHIMNSCRFEVCMSCFKKYLERDRKSSLCLYRNVETLHHSKRMALLFG